ncbi:MAG TPA: CDP-alcohol phosphatidyltransferase family protein [Allosphingosinicella sp.]
MATTAGKSGASGGGRPPAAGKPRELDDVLNRRVFHPLSRRLAAALAPTFVTPNMVSVSGALLVLAAGAFYAGFTGIGFAAAVAVGFALHMLWHVVDGADGHLARMTGRASAFGEMVDGICDYSSHALLYLLLATYLDDQIGLWAYPLGLLAGFSRVAQANHSESQRRIYMWRAYGIPWMQQARASEDDVFRRKGGAGALARLASAYLWLADALSPASAELDRAAEAAACDPEARRRLTRLCRSVFRGPLFLQGLLGANPRTVLLGISMALGSPLFFFLAETTVMNLLLVASVRRQKRANVTLARRLAA